jgi:Ion channel
MMTTSERSRSDFHLQVGQFWSGDLGLTLITISLILLVFIITPLRESGMPGRFMVDLLIVFLMVFGGLTIEQSRLAKYSVVAFLLITAVFVGVARAHPTPLMHQLGSILSTLSLILYVRIVLVVMFRAGPITWSRIQGGVSAYLLLGMAWASAYQVVEQFRPGSFRFVTTPADFDQLISKLTYYSFCTLTTVGGEVAPVSPIARSLTTAESMAGQLFPAILIGALVALAVQSRAKS